MFHNEIVGKSSLTWMHFVVSPADGGLRKRLSVRLGSFTLASELLERKNIWLSWIRDVLFAAQARVVRVGKDSLLLLLLW